MPSSVKSPATFDLPPDTVIKVRRHWDDYNIGDVAFGSLSGLHWDSVSGGFGRASPKPMVYGYMDCTALIAGSVSHSCAHGPAPHRIKVVVVKKDNDRKVVEAIRAIANAFRPRARTP